MKINSISFAVAALAKRNYIKLEFFLIAAMVVIVCGRIVAPNTLQSQWAWHSTIFDFVVNSLAGAVFLRFAFTIIFIILFDMLAIVLLPLTHIFGALFFASFIAIPLAAAIFCATPFPTLSFRFSVSTKPIIALGNLFYTNITRCTQTLGLVLSFPITSFTNNDFSHTVIIL